VFTRTWNFAGFGNLAPIPCPFRGLRRVGKLDANSQATTFPFGQLPQASMSVPHWSTGNTENELLNHVKFLNP
jgi:hypothetical protein